MDFRVENTTHTVLTSSTQPRVLLYHIHKFDSCKALAGRKKTELKTAQRLEIEMPIRIICRLIV